MTLARILYLIAPLVVAGIVHGLAIKKKILPSLARPLDGERTFRGHRIFGANKTWRGLILMSAVSVLVVLCQHELYRLSAFRAVSLIDYSATTWLGFGLALGLGYSLAELPNSFVKRQLSIPPGGGRAILQYIVDQGDSALGGTLAIALFVDRPIDTLLMVFGVGFALHAAMDQLFYVFAVKHPVPLSAHSRWEGSQS